MTVKRLDSNQPDSFTFNKEDNDLIDRILKNYPKDRKQSLSFQVFTLLKKEQVVGFLKKQYQKLLKFLICLK